MPTRITWYNTEKTILFEEYFGNITIKEFMQMVDDAFAMISTQKHTVHIIANATDVRVTPRNPLTGAKYAENRVAPNQGIVIYVNVNLFVQSIINVAKATGNRSVRNLYFARSIAEAEKIVQSKTVIPYY